MVKAAVAGADSTMKYFHSPMEELTCWKFALALPQLRKSSEPAADILVCAIENHDRFNKSHRSSRFFFFRPDGLGAFAGDLCRNLSLRAAHPVALGRRRRQPRPGRRPHG